MKTHRIYKVWWQENGRKKKSWFAEIIGRYWAELKERDALRITHPDLHAIEKSHLASCVPMNTRLEDYFDEVVLVRTVEGS